MELSKKRLYGAAAASAAAALVLAACGGDDDGGDGGTTGGGEGEPWILGTTDTVTSLDPAGSYDLGSSSLQYSLYQNLLTIPSGENTPQGDAAESCEYDDPQTFTCTIKEGLKFSNGNDLTASDVKFSLERNINIAEPDGASGLLASLMDEEGALLDGAIEAPDDQTVTFHLNKPDTTFQFVLTYAAMAIVDEDTFPADELLADEEIVGSGPFALEEYQNGKQASLMKNEEYQGDREAQSPQVLIQYYKESSNLVQAIEQGDVQIAWRSMSPTEINDLKSNDEVDVHEGEGAEIRYFVWQFSEDVAKDQATRQAVAQVMDREAIADRAYDGTVDPLYSMVPPGFPGQVDAFTEKYGEPNVDAAETLLNDAGIKTPVNLTLGYTPTHYGPNALDEATELQRQLNESGLFKVKLDSLEWEEYQTAYKKGAYDLFHLGWFPDFLDADNYLSPFLVDGGFYENNYSSDEVNGLVSQEQGSSDPAEREQVFGDLQNLVAEDVPVIPSWVGKNTAVSSPGIENIDNSLDPSFIFRTWEITYSGE